MKVDLSNVKRQIETMRCPEHHEAPKANIVGDSIKLIACCDNFMKQLKPKMDRLIKEAARKSIDDELRNIFGK